MYKPTSLLNKIIGISSCLIFLLSPLFSQTSLSAGDIAFTGYHSDDATVSGNEEIKFVLLKDITSGTVIYFTDFGWESTNDDFQSANPCGVSTGAVSDGIVKWEATANMNCGDEVIIYCKTSPSTTSGTATGEQATYNSSSYYLNLSSAGEQIFAYQGTYASPTLIAAINYNDSWDVLVIECLFSSTQSVLSAALNSNNT